MGEYSNPPVLSPMGNKKDPLAVNVFLTSLPPVAIIILEADGPTTEITAAGPSVRLFAPRSKFPVVNVSVPLTVTDTPKIASPLD